ncbi:MAG: DUF4982 domain-containing protein, partial [Gammaproteobacteria bacterium]
EPTPNAWPSVSSVFGIMDMNGFAKTAYYIHQVQWIRDRPLVHIAPHWNWSGREGSDVRVMVMSNAERVALALNGTVVGEQQVDPYRMNYFNVRYAPGKLEAIAYRGGKEVARSAVETTGPAVRVDLAPDRAGLAGDGRDAMPVTVRALDAAGRAVPVSDAQVTFTVTGAGKSIGHGNGDPNSHEDEKGPTRKLYNGLAQLIVQSEDNSQGEVVVEAHAPALAPARIAIPVKKVAPVPTQATSEAPFTVVSYWRVSPPSSTRPDPSQAIADFDMNTWEYGEPPLLRGGGSAAGEGNFRVHRAKFTPRTTLANGNGLLHFSALDGRAEIWLDGKLIAKKDTFESGELWAPLPAGTGERVLSVLVEGQNGQRAGVAGRVTVEPAR